MDWNTHRKRILPPLHPYTKQIRPLIRDKTGHDDELICYTTLPIPEIRERLVTKGFKPHPVSTLKYLATGSERIYESLSMAYHETIFASHQTHTYIFDLGDTRAIYSHREYSITRPVKHQNAKEHQTPGDPKNRLPEF